jgi:thiol-disulfide isomerase/thioredoxin
MAKGGVMRRVRGMGLVGLVFLAAMVVLGAACTSSEPGSAQPVELPVPSDFAFNVFEGAEEVGGTDLMLSEIIGTGMPVIVNFYGATCPPCLKELPVFQQVYEQRGTEFLMLGIDVTDVAGFGTAEQAQELLDKTGVQYPLATAPHANLIVKYGFNKIPSTIFINGEGRLYKKVIGPVDLEGFEALVDDLIASS